MAVVEKVAFTTAIESERKLTYEELENEAETRRVKGKLSRIGAVDVVMWLDKAYKDKRILRENIFAD